MFFRVRDYVTEKVYNGLQSGTLPVYWGAENVEDFVPRGSVVKVCVRQWDVFLCLCQLHLFVSCVSKTSTSMSSSGPFGSFFSAFFFTPYLCALLFACCVGLRFLLLLGASSLYTQGCITANTPRRLVATGASMSRHLLPKQRNV